MFRHWGSVPYLHMRHPLQGWEHPQASRQHGSTVPGQAGTASGFCVLLQALGGGGGGFHPPVPYSSLPSNHLPVFERSIISFFPDYAFVVSYQLSFLSLFTCPCSLNKNHRTQVHASPFQNPPQDLDQRDSRNEKEKRLGVFKSRTG